MKKYEDKKHGKIVIYKSNENIGQEEKLFSTIIGVKEETGEIKLIKNRYGFLEDEKTKQYLQSLLEN